MGQQGLAGKECGHQGRGGRQEQDAPASVGEPNEKPQPQQDAGKSQDIHSLNPFEQVIQVECGAMPQIFDVLLQE